MVVVVFRSRFKPDADMAAYAELAKEMRKLVARHPGFISIENFTGPDDTELSLEFFESEESVLAWRRRPEHLTAQRRGREEFYEWYSVHTSEVIRHHEMDLED